MYIANNNLSTDILPFTQDQQPLQRATIQPEYARPQNKYVKAVSQSCPHCPTINLFETQHFILTHSYNQPSNATILNFKTYYF
jgi:hypothetical protein